MDGVDGKREISQVLVEFPGAFRLRRWPGLIRFHGLRGTCQEPHVQRQQRPHG